jgi:TPR repeat protein
MTTSIEDLYAIGLDLKSNRQYAKAERCFCEAAERGHLRAAGECARMHIFGIGGIPVDRAKGLQLCRNAAESGDDLSLFLIAECHYNGWGVEADFVQALAFYKQASEKGNFEAANACGDAHLNGDGTQCDPIKALEYFQIAAKGGHAGAATALSFLQGLPYPGANYFTGIGVDKVNVAAGLVWCQRAADLGNVQASAELGRRLVFGGGNPPQQLDRAQSLLLRASEQGHAGAKGTLSLLQVMRVLQSTYNYDWRDCRERDVMKARAQLLVVAVVLHIVAFIFVSAELLLNTTHSVFRRLRK